MLSEVARPARREPARTTVFAQLQRAFEVVGFDVEPCESGGMKNLAGSRRQLPLPNSA